VGPTEPVSHPAGYPAQYEEELLLADGRSVSLRPILPSDAAELAHAIQHADPATVRSRFLGAAPPVTPELLRGLTELDYVRRFALVAFADGHGVAVARYIAATDPPTEAEIAIVVDPQWRRVGLATELVQRLARRAVECGITSFTALYWSQNRPVAELAHSTHAKVLIADGVAQLRARLTEGAS